MIDRLDDRLTTTQRLLLGLGIAFGSVFLPWVLVRDPMQRVLYAQGVYAFNLQEYSFGVFLLIGTIMLASAVGAALIARWWGLVLVPLAVFIGCVIGIHFFVEVMWDFYDLGVIPLVVEAFVGALLGFAFMKRTQVGGLVTRTRNLSRGIPAPQTPARPQPIPVSPSASVKQQGKVAAPLQTSRQPSVPAQHEPEQGDIARIVAQMQQEYAEASPNAQNDGNPKMG